MKIQFSLFVVAAALSFTGCFTEIRSNSYAELPAQESTVVIPLEQRDSEKVLTDLFSKRGFQLVDERPAANGATVCIFKGTRDAVTVVSGGRYGVSGSSNSLGSVFYTFLFPNGAKTQVQFFGKPTVDGKIPCSDADATLALPCDGIVTGAMWPGLDRAEGREEAEAIRGIELELKHAVQGVEQAAPKPVIVPAAPAAGASCHLENTPAWHSASAAQKKQMLDECRANAASTPAQ